MTNTSEQQLVFGLALNCLKNIGRADFDGSALLAVAMIRDQRYPFLYI